MDGPDLPEKAWYDMLFKFMMANKEEINTRVSALEERLEKLEYSDEQE